MLRRRSQVRSTTGLRCGCGNQTSTSAIEWGEQFLLRDDCVQLLSLRHREMSFAVALTCNSLPATEIRLSPSTSPQTGAHRADGREIDLRGPYRAELSRAALSAPSGLATQSKSSLGEEGASL